MPFGSMGDGGIGSAIGSAVGKIVKPTVSRSTPRTSRPKKTIRNTGGSSSNKQIKNGRGKLNGGVSIPENSSIPPPKAGSIDAYLGSDAAYQGVLRGNKRTLQDYLSELGRRRGEAGTQYNQTKASMERDRIQQLADLREEYASRGLIQSGIYADEQGKFQQQFIQQSQALEQQQAALLADLLSQEKNYRRENDLALEKAKQDALARRAAKLSSGIK